MAGTDRARGMDGLAPAPAVVLVGTQLGENIGTTARAMLNFGLCDLRLVRPKCGWPNVKALAASSGASGVLNHVRLHDALGDAIADLHHLYATTARPRELTKPVLTPRAAASQMRTQVDAGRRVGILFGPERTGLANEELLLADAIVSVPLNPGYASLNIAQTVLLTGYEWFQSGTTVAPRQEPEGVIPATKGELAGLLDHLVAELDAIEFFRTPDRRASMVPTLQATFARAELATSEVQLLRGVVKDLARGGRRKRG